MADESETPHRGALSETEESGYSEQEDRLALYEWSGGLAAGMGFFLTPVLTALPAAYCAYQIREEKPVTAWLIVGLILATAVFWLIVYVFIIAP